MKKNISLPSWFKEDRYKHLNCAEQPDAGKIWLSELERCADLICEQDARKNGQPHWRDEFRGTIGGLSVGKKIVPIENLVPDYIGPAPITIIAKDESYKTLFPGWPEHHVDVRETAYDPSEAKSFPVLSVSLNFDAPDAILMRDFGKLLGEIRKQIPSPVKVPGEKGDALNGTFTASQFASWWDWRMVQLCDLDYYFSQDEKADKPTDVQMGKWLYGDKRNQPGREIAEARQKLRDAISKIPALYAYCLRQGV